METTVQVTAPHFCAGMVLVDGIVREAAPILKWAIGEHEQWLRRYFKRKGWKYVLCNEQVSGGDTAHR